mmetsp:Transcript_22877/g.40912  ORF Transcript_22877/g.40912 Transcript_22877/m.40912 type:complete len:326 (+) Transcript_22877:84-1061(+)
MRYRSITVMLGSMLGTADLAMGDFSGLSGAGHSALSLLKLLKQKHPSSSAMLEETPGMKTFDLPLGGDLKLPHFLQGLAAGPRKGLSPVQMEDMVDKSCHDVPDLIRQDWYANQCRGNATEYSEMIKWVLSSLSAFKEGRAVSMPEELKGRVHEMSERICDQPECVGMYKKLLDHGISCQTTAMCALESKAVPVGLCRIAMRGLFKKATSSEMQTMCEVETGTSTFCQEVSTTLMVEHMDCWVQLNNPLEGCTAKCAKVWSAARSKYPHCSMVLASKTVQTQSMLFGFAKKLGVEGHGGAMNGLVRSPDEICTDLSLQDAETFHI